jgi:hypothetical protein
MNLLHVHVMLLLLVVLLLVVVVVVLLLLLLLLNGECVRGSSDVLDGWVRRRRSQTSQRTPHTGTTHPKGAKQRLPQSRPRRTQSWAGRSAHRLRGAALRSPWLWD